MQSFKGTNVFFRNCAPDVVKKFGNPKGITGTDKRIVVNRGGGGSSKTRSVMQVMLYRFFTEESKRILICRKTLPSLKASTFAFFLQSLEDDYGMNVMQLRQEKVMMNYYYKKNLIHFAGVDDVEKIKSSEWNYVWMEEATDFSYNDFKILNLYCRAPSKDGKKNQVFLSFNPVSEYHWIKEDLIDSGNYPDLEEIVSTYKDNPYLDGFAKQQYKDLEHQDRNYYRIYALGEWGRLDHLVYSNFDYGYLTRDYHEVIFGLDFGFNHETALIKLYLGDDQLWEDGLLYETGLTNADLIERLRELIPPEERDLPLYCDSAEPARVEEIQRAGFNAIAAKKGPDSVKAGIDLVRRHRVWVLNENEDVMREKKGYAYKIDKNGKRTEEPVKWRDHYQDAERIALYTHLVDGGGDVNVRFL